MRTLLACALFSALSAPASAAEVVEFSSPHGVTERCVLLSPIPGGRYSDEDRAQERSYCAVDFYAPHVALCPKTWSTSPATIVYDVSGGPFAGDAASFERRACGEGGSARKEAHAELAIYKQSINAADTSAVFAPAALAYYHLSRYFETSVRVPVAVHRTIDRRVHLERVTTPGLKDTPPGGMVHKAWSHFQEAGRNPGEYREAAELLTDDGRQLFGVLLLEPGRRYGSEVNGTRASGWGIGQVHDFQQTAPYRALRSASPLAQAVEEGLAAARLDPTLRRDTGDASPVQVVYWMKELVEIALLDFILGQQDRVGNVDYERYWHWVEDGRVHERLARGKEPPPEAAPHGPALLKRTWISDNDAAVRETYTNFADKGGMIEGLRHVPGGLYRKLVALDRDLASQGPLYAYVRDSFGLSPRQLARVVERTHRAAETFRVACRNGTLAFDLDPEAFLAKGAVEPEAVSCDRP